MIQWNIQFPLDRWWRDRHSIAFGSPVHRRASFIDMAFEFAEFRYFQKMQEEKDDLSDLKFTDEERVQLGMPTALAKAPQVKMTQKEIDIEFDNLDLSQFNDPK